MIEHVSYLDSKGLAELIACYKELRGMGGEVSGRAAAGPGLLEAGACEPRTILSDQYRRVVTRVVKRNPGIVRLRAQVAKWSNETSSNQSGALVRN